MTQKRFIDAATTANEETFVNVMGRIYSQLHAMANEEVPQEDPYYFLHEVICEMKESSFKIERSGLRSVINQAFEDALQKIPGSEIHLLIRGLHRIMTGQISHDRAPWGYVVVGPDVSVDDYSKISARQRSLILQKKHRMPCSAAYNHKDIEQKRGVLLEAPLSASEIMIAGAAIASNLDVVLLGEVEGLSHIPSFNDPDEAFLALVEMSSSKFNVSDELDLDNLPADMTPCMISPDAELAAWKLYAKISDQSYQALMHSAIFSSDRHIARSAELDKMIREPETPSHVQEAYFQIVANGSRSGCSPVEAQKINGMRHKIEELQRKLNQADEPTAL